MIKLKDAIDGITELEDQSVDLSILDPNYQDWSKLIDQGLIDLVMRKTKPQGSLIAFTRQPFDYDLRVKIHPFHRRTIIWSFTNGGAWVSKTLPLVSHQMVFWFSASKQPHINVRTGQAYSHNTRTFKRSSKVFGDWKQDGREFSPSSEGTWMRDHYHFNKPHKGKTPAKPDELARILINCLCPQGGLVLDPFAGSGVFCRIAQSIGRSFIGFENSPEAYDALKCAHPGLVGSQ